MELRHPSAGSDPFTAAMSTRIDCTGLPGRTITSLTNGYGAPQFTYVGEVVQMTEQELLRIPDLGRKSLNAIKGYLEERGLFLCMGPGSWVPPSEDHIHD
jgi:DNA-directed RNA polymerase subunit alpha